VHISEFDFDLPPERIAQNPASDRTAARLLHLDRASGAVAHARIAALPERLRAGDLVVVNNTRVFPARLIGHRVPSGGAVECLLVRQLETGSDPRFDPKGRRRQTETGSDPKGGAVWEALVHPGQKLHPGGEIVFPGAHPIRGEILEQHFFGRRTVRLWTEDGSPLDEAIDAIGHVPLPPYIKRDDSVADRERYQTIFADQRGSVAAPTAGLHFTPNLVGALMLNGIEIVEITLHVGYGTFQPVRVERVEDHRLEAERYEISDQAAATIESARSADRRVIAVGTTTTRTLEAVASTHEGRVVAGAGSTDLFIAPGFRFQVIGGLLTNFHLPRSSLLMLVCAFAGRERVLAAYNAAIRERYRFYSYGDAMLIT
jgi:S-adenosylmethionine:tRNA ribosyltransferase-isomerase